MFFLFIGHFRYRCQKFMYIYMYNIYNIYILYIYIYTYIHIYIYTHTIKLKLFTSIIKCSISCIYIYIYIYISYTIKQFNWIMVKNATESCNHSKFYVNSFTAFSLITTQSINLNWHSSYQAENCKAISMKLWVLETWLYYFLPLWNYT